MTKVTSTTNTPPTVTCEECGQAFGFDPEGLGICGPCAKRLGLITRTPLGYYRPTPTDKAPGTICQHCGKRVKLNEIVRTATHDLGCKHCYQSR